MNYPDNIEEIKKFAKDNNIDVKYLLGEKWESDLWLDYIESLPNNIVFNVDGCLDLPSVKSLSDNIVFNVGGWLDLYSVIRSPKNIVFNVGGWLSLRSVQSLSSNTIFNVDGNIYFPTDHKVKVIWS